MYYIARLNSFKKIFFLGGGGEFSGNCVRHGFCIFLLHYLFPVRFSNESTESERIICQEDQDLGPGLQEEVLK